MPLFSAFCAGSNTERSTSMDAEKSVNLYRSTIEQQGSAKQAYLLGTPGRRLLGTVDRIGTRGIFTQDGRTWAVIGDQLGEILSWTPFVFNVLGVIALDAIHLTRTPQPVSFASDGDGGSQLAIVGGGQLKILHLVTGALSDPVTLPLSNPPGMIGFLDGYFLLSEQDSLRTWFSAIENGGVWDALDFFTRSTASDRIVAMICGNNRVWIFGSETSQAYENVGDPDNPFQPIKGSLFQIGCAAPWAVSVGVNTIRWVGESSRGGAMVYRLDGYTGTRISTHAIEAQLATATTLRDAEAFTYEQDGHLFYALTCPSLGPGGLTVVLDETEQAWHQRSTWNFHEGRDDLWGVRGHAFVGTRHVVGSRDSGAIAALELDTYDDLGAMLRAVRRAPYLSAENAWAFIDRVELGIESGVGQTMDPGADPQVELRLSKDSGKTWWSAGTSSLGRIGEYGTCAFWTMLGRARLDRLVFEIVLSDPVKRVLGPGLWITATPGRRQAAA
jgi:hypothetical protein